MGVIERGVHPGGFFPNGLLPNKEASVTRKLNKDRWRCAEERTAELISCIRPSQPSEDLRNAVASYVCQLIIKCFPACQVFPFGSVPLKTYLPDGDIDLTVFSNDQNLDETWANEVQNILECEEKNKNAELHVKEVQYIQAEVRIIKCLVENIVVDISYSQLGGLSTLCFLEKVDRLINQNHLFKQSVILIKAWCYYESRILGAHHGLISTYALETLVLYIFHVFNNTFAGPLEVLYRFLEFFSSFDWDNFCISLWGPVPISSLPNMMVDAPRKDGKELLLSKLFMDACCSVHAVCPGWQENQEQSFASKFFNVVDPLRANNNLGRSVSKGNFFRIRSAFSFGAQRLARLLDCPRKNLLAELDQFFLNTWNRHGSGPRPDAFCPNQFGLHAINSSQIDGSEIFGHFSGGIKAKEDSGNNDFMVKVPCDAHGCNDVLSQHENHSLKSASRCSNKSAVSHNPGQKTRPKLGRYIASDQKRQILRFISSNDSAKNETRRSTGIDNRGNEVNAGNSVARAHSSSETMDALHGPPFCGRHNNASKTGNSARSDNSRYRNVGPEVLENHSSLLLTGDPLASNHSSSHESIDVVTASNGAPNCFYGDCCVGMKEEDRYSHAMKVQVHQEEQDHVNMMASFSSFGFNGKNQRPINLASGQPSTSLLPYALASHGYAQKDLNGIIPLNGPSVEVPWAFNMHYSQGCHPFQENQYFRSMGRTPNQEEMSEQAGNNLVSTQSSELNGDSGFRSEQDGDSVRCFDHNNKISLVQLPQDRIQVPLGGLSNSVHSLQVSSSGSFSLGDYRLTAEDECMIGENHSDVSRHKMPNEVDPYSSASLTFAPASLATSSGSNLSSNDYYDRSLLRTSNSTKNRQQRISTFTKKAAEFEDKKEFKCEDELVAHISSQADNDDQGWIPLSTVDVELSENTVSGGMSSSYVWTHPVPRCEPAPVNGSTSILPINPVLGGSEARERANDKHEVQPFAFYGTGPPIPFLAMIPIDNLPSEMKTSILSTDVDREKEFFNFQNYKSDRVLDSTGDIEKPGILNNSKSVNGISSVEPSKQHRSDILNGDFASHWQNLQYGWFCQNVRHNGSLLYPSFGVPPMHLQGYFSQGPGGPPAHVNLFNQSLKNGTHHLPNLQNDSSRTACVHPTHGDKIPGYCGGTGTYLPNPISFRNRQYSKARKNGGNYNSERNSERKEYHMSRQGNWNSNSTSRFGGHSHSLSQSQKPTVRMDGSKASSFRYNDKPFKAKQDSLPPYRSHRFGIKDEYAIQGDHEFSSPDQPSSP